MSIDSFKYIYIYIKKKKIVLLIEIAIRSTAYITKARCSESLGIDSR